MHDLDLLDADLDELAALSVLGMQSERGPALAALMERQGEWAEAHGSDPAPDA